MSRKVIASVVVVALPLLAWSQATQDNPFKNASVGDFAKYKMTVQIMDKAIETTMKQTVTAKDEKSVTVKVTVTTMGKDFQGDDMKIDLTKPFDPLKMINQKAGGPKFEKTGEGKEKITVAGKQYECKWIAGKVADKTGTSVKLWTSPAIPLGGLAKMETKSTFANMTLMLTETGSAK